MNGNVFCDQDMERDDNNVEVIGKALFSTDLEVFYLIQIKNIDSDDKKSPCQVTRGYFYLFSHLPSLNLISLKTLYIFLTQRTIMCGAQNQSFFLVPI